MKSILCGLAIVYFGFRLFRLGFFEKAGELQIAWGSKYLTLKQAAPGTVFAIFGAGIILAAVWQGLEFKLDAPGSEIARSHPLSGYKPLPESLKSALKAAADGKQLAEAERKALTAWLETPLLFERSIDFRADDKILEGRPKGG